METVSERRNLWEFLEQEPRWAKETKALFQWSLNFDFGQRPWELFLDLIGWSADNVGADLYDGRYRSIGYMEADYLGDALKEWADAPHEVEAWIAELMGCEG